MPATKHILIFLLAMVSCGCTYAQVHPGNTNQVNIPELENKAHAGLFTPVRPGVVNNYDLKYHRCEWQVNPDSNYIKGAITSYFKPTTGNFKQVQFDLEHTFVVDSVKYHHSLLPFALLPNDILEINLPAIVPVHTLDSVSVYYQGKPASTGFGSFVRSTHANVPVIWTLSEPFGAKDWWPCKQSLNDKIDSVDILVTTPQGNRVASNGVLVSETVSGTGKVFHWRTKYPIAAYLIAIAVTNYVYYSDYVPLSATDSLQVLNYVYPEYLSSAAGQTKHIVDIIKLYDSLAIPYPFAKEKYGHAQFGWGGGMEHQTMSFMGNFDYGLMAHECAHQWFGDHITCGSWQDIWLNEGFATYFEGLTVERYFPQRWLGWKEAKISNITALPGGSVMCDDTLRRERIFDGRLTYNKGAYLLHMLRWKLGDALFFQSLKNYLNDTKLAGGYAKTPDLINHLEHTGAQSLKKFFDQWYYSQGHPSYQVSYAQFENELELIINQTQSHPSVAFFEMPVPVKFIGFNQDTTIVFNHRFSGEHFLISLPFKITDVKFDPERWILSDKNVVRKIATENPAVIFPNPTRQDISISLLLQNPEDLVFEIVDLNGKKVYDQKEYITEKNIQKNIVTSHFANGTYILRIKGNTINYSEKFTKQ